MTRDWSKPVAVSDIEKDKRIAELEAALADAQGQIQAAGIISDHAIKLDDDRQTWKHKARELEAALAHVMTLARDEVRPREDCEDCRKAALLLGWHGPTKERGDG